MPSQLQNDNAPDLSEPEEEEELLKLEEEIKAMAQTIFTYRTTFPDELGSTLSSLLALPRAILPIHSVEQGLVIPARSQNVVLIATGELEEAEKIKLLKQKISSNASMMPIVLKRLKEYTSKIDNLQLTDEIIHPSFKRKQSKINNLQLTDEIIHPSFKRKQSKIDNLQLTDEIIHPSFKRKQR